MKAGLAIKERCYTFFNNQYEHFLQKKSTLTHTKKIKAMAIRYRFKSNFTLVYT